MKNILLIIQIVVAVCLAGSILLQSRGTGLGSAFGDFSEQYRSKRGLEKLLFRATIILMVFFVITSGANLLVK